jgi:UDPglucose--hexose-1-phosphate uridylyltransferase
MPEMRYNLITGEWVIVATDRTRRPHDLPISAAQPAPPTHSDSCPFCPGNEAQTESETFRAPDQGPWQLRVVPNRYPALTSEGHPVRTGAGYNMAMSGVGSHEVIIESPLHDRTLATLPDDQIALVLQAYRERMEQLYRLPQIEHVIVFKNHGEAAGCSLAHPHSQVVGTPVVSGQVRQRIENGLKFFGDNGECIYCHCLRKELANGQRILSQNEDFVAFIPFAALSPFHLWIFPRRHSAYFGDQSPLQIEALAGVLGDVLRRLYHGLGDPAFNLVIRSLSPTEQELRYFHWYLSIVPRATRTAGFELGTGMYLNTRAPEEAAAFLRGVAMG